MTSNHDDFNEKIVELIINKQQHEDDIKILETQEELGNTIDLTMLQLEITWRNLEVQAMQANINFLRYKQDKLDSLRSTHEQIELSETIQKTLN
ncbi:unnamed protein product [Rotaria sp. Silwood2]|nr:unnamed protein product [Rotaria sp. Silwood2]CAF2604255.1 unnamed protein product [Rotaria sp. Silwood2]CAF2829710.1 unnamed protein product [Rotaria sp. Silwood2]CAF4276997.1 unnamed protein product [Rotaria sp. Silwood2]CAF4319703.1 unnamed protein product [Rotaria sp. Silwood2]